MRVPQPGECGAGHISAIGGWDDIPAQVWCIKQDGSELVRDRNDSVCGLCFEIIYRVLLIVQKGHSAPDGQRAALNVRPLQSKRFFLTKPAVQTEGAEYAGAWFYDYIHQNIDLIGKQSLFLFRFSVRGDLDPLSGIINNQVIQTCFLKKLPHSQKNLTLQAFRSGCNTSHNLSDVNRFYVSEFHISDLFHDVEIIAISVHFDGGGP